MMGLSPDHEIGFSVLVAGQSSTAATWAIGDLILNIIIPGLDGVAKEEAEARFAGRHTSGNDSLTVSVDSGPGLKLSEWYNNGKNMLESLSILRSGQVVKDIDVRLYPTGLVTEHQISFRSVISGLPSPIGPPNGPLTSACSTWVLVGSTVYGSVALDEFGFGFEDGKASVSPRVLRTVLRQAN